MAFNKAQAKKLVTPVLAGAASQAAASINPEFGPAAGSIIVGTAMKNAFAQEMGAFQLGAAVARRATGAEIPNGGLI